MPSRTLDRTSGPHASEDEGAGARVLPFSRANLGKGADTAAGSRELASLVAEEYPLGGSPVWLPGDPRLASGD